MGESTDLSPELVGKDLSLLQKPIMLSVQNVRQVLNCLNSGTTEMKDLLLNECGLLYECKVCRSIFRSVHRFVGHRLAQCQQVPLIPSLESFFRLPHHYTQVVQPEGPGKEEYQKAVPPSPAPPAVKRNKRKASPHKNPHKSSATREPTLVSCQLSTETLGTKLSKSSLQNLENSSPSHNHMADETPNNSSQSCHSIESLASHVPLNKPLDNMFKENISPVMNHLLIEEHAFVQKDQAVHKFDSFINDLVDEIKTKKKSQNTDGSEEQSKIKRKSLNSLFSHVLNASKFNIEHQRECFGANEDIFSTDEMVQHSHGMNGGPLFKMYNANFKDPGIKNFCALDQPAKSWNGKILENCIKQLEIKKKSSKNMTIQLTPIPGNRNAMFQVSVPEGEKTKQPVQLWENSLEQKPLIVVLSKQCPDDPNSKNGPNSLAASLANHMKEEQASSSSFCCTKCQAHFVSAKTLHIHNLKIHAPNRTYFPCPFCKTTFVQLWSACRHLESVHNKSKEQIPKLRETIKKRGFLKRNELCNIKPKNSNPVIPSGLQPFKCPKCSKAFAKHQQLATHNRFCTKKLKVEKRKPSSCSPPTPMKSSLLVNVKKSFKDKKNSIVLKKIESEAKDRIQGLTNNVLSRPKRFNTNKKMDKDFVNSQTYRLKDVSKSKKTKKSPSKGMLSNPSLKKTVLNIESKVMSLINLATLECVKCQKSFSSFSNLRRHTAIHIGWKRYCCRKCQRAFYNRSQCREHLSKLHSVEKPDEFIEELPFKAAFSGRQKIVKFTQPQNLPEKNSSASSVPKSPSKTKGSKGSKGSPLSSSPSKLAIKKEKKS